MTDHRFSRAQAGVVVWVPESLREHSQGAREVHVPLASIVSLAELLERLVGIHPMLESDLRDENGQLHPRIALYLDGEDIRLMYGTATVLGPGQQVQIRQSPAS